MHDRPRARSEGVVTERIEDELVVYDELSHTAHCLSRDAASVWERCDGRRSEAEIAEQLELAPATVERAVEALGECGLLDQGPAAGRGYSRREATLRLAKAGGAAFAAPLIYSAAVASVAAALSPNPACKTQPPGCTGLMTGTVAVGTSVASCSGTGPSCSASITCGNFTNASCCHGICATTNGAGCSSFICSTQYNCVLRGAACPTSTNATCGPSRNLLCCSPNGKPVACSTTTGANYGCCSGQCSGGVCT